MSNTVDLESKFELKGDLTKRKIIQYLPAMMMTNISTLLLVSVDGLVVGNFVGKDALSSVNIFAPATMVGGLISALLSAGAATRLSESMGQINIKALLETRSTLKLLMVIGALLVAVLQIPIVWIIISSYHLSPEMNSMVWSYAIGVMISLPFGLVSAIGVLQLQIVGKMKVLMVLAMVEGGANLLLDLLFVGPLEMGVAGAGFGTAGANIIRCSVTLIYLIKKTDMFYSGDAKPTMIEARRMIGCGLPETANFLMVALQGYIIMSLILDVIGESGGTIKGVCSFAFSLSTVVVGSIQGALRPLLGLMSGANNTRTLKILMRQGVLFVIGLTGILTVLIEIFPGFIYKIHGVSDIPEGGILALRFFATYLVFNGIDTIFRLYFTNRKILKFSTTLTVVGNALLPLFAFVLSRFLPGPYMWLCYIMTESVILVTNIIRYSIQMRRDKEMMGKLEKDLCLTVTPDNVIEASREIRKYCEENNINRKHAFRSALCLEEMVAYAEKSRGSEDVNVLAFIRFYTDSALLMILDDGKCIYLDDDKFENEKIVTSNYGLLKKLSKSVEYQYVLDLNYTMCRY